jgi:hypothetical protein
VTRSPELSTMDSFMPSLKRWCSNVLTLPRSCMFVREDKSKGWRQNPRDWVHAIHSAYQQRIAMRQYTRADILVWLQTDDMGEL